MDISKSRFKESRRIWGDDCMMPVRSLYKIVTSTTSSIESVNLKTQVTSKMKNPYLGMVVYYLSSILLKCVLRLQNPNKLTFAFYIENNLRLLLKGP